MVRVPMYASVGGSTDSGPDRPFRLFQMSQKLLQPQERGDCIQGGLNDFLKSGCGFVRAVSFF